MTAQKWMASGQIQYDDAAMNNAAHAARFPVSLVRTQFIGGRDCGRASVIVIPMVAVRCTNPADFYYFPKRSPRKRSARAGNNLHQGYSSVFSENEPYAAAIGSQHSSLTRPQRLPGADSERLLLS